MSDHEQNTPQARGGDATRRTVLRLGAIAVPAVVTLKPAFAANSSVMNCEIPIDKWVDQFGNVQTANAQNAFAPPSRPYTGEEIRTLDKPAGVSQDAFNAHVEYIKKMQRGTPGFTCFASIAARQIV
jgi:hypothetical protein